MREVQADKPQLTRGKPRYETFTDWARDTAGVVTIPIARVLSTLGIHPNTLTVLGFVLNVGVAFVLSTGRLTLGGWLLALIAPIDALDGALARVIGQKSRFGAFLDSTLDRLSEAALLIGLAIYYLQQGAFAEVILAVVVLVGSMMVSYTRARAEALGISCKVGLLTRIERMAVLVIGLILGYSTVALWILAIGTNLTALQRILRVYRASRQGESDLAA